MTAQRQKQDKYCEQPPSLTVLVPGFGDSEYNLRGFARHLEERVGPTIALSPQPSDGRVGIDKLAEMLALQLEPWIQRVYAINLVGFSMGGLICRYYYQFLATNLPLQRLVTIACPHNGTWSAYSLSCPACLQMRPGSQFLRKLNHDLTILQQVQFVSIWSPFDLTIIPAFSSWLPVGEIVTIASPLHQTMLFDPRVLSAVSVRLAH